MTTTFTKDELAFIHRVMSGLPLGIQKTPETLVKASEVDEKAKVMRAELAAMPERGELVLRWEVPKELALTLNAYAGSRGWKKHKDRKLLDTMLGVLLGVYPRAALHGAHKRRWCRVTRFSPTRVDELAVDILGGKLPCDALTRADVLHDDTDAFMVREPRWVKCKRGETRLLVEVFDLAEHEVAAPEPSCEMVPFKYEPGPMTRAIMEGR